MDLGELLCRFAVALADDDQLAVKRDSAVGAPGVGQRASGGPETLSSGGIISW
jgi:hypothetical protein